LYQILPLKRIFPIAYAREGTTGNCPASQAI